MNGPHSPQLELGWLRDKRVPKTCPRVPGTPGMVNPQNGEVSGMVKPGMVNSGMVKPQAEPLAAVASLLLNH